MTKIWTQTQEPNGGQNTSIVPCFIQTKILTNSYKILKMLSFKIWKQEIVKRPWNDCVFPRWATSSPHGPLLRFDIFQTWIISSYVMQFHPKFLHSWSNFLNYLGRSILWSFHRLSHCRGIVCHFLWASEWIWAFFCPSQTRNGRWQKQQTLQWLENCC